MLLRPSCCLQPHVIHSSVRAALPSYRWQSPPASPLVNCTVIPLAKELYRAIAAYLPAAISTDCPAPALQVAASALEGPAGALTSLLEDCTDSALELDRLLKEALLEQLCTSHEGLKGLAHAVLHGHLPFNLPQLLKEEGGTLPSQLPVSVDDV